MLRRKRCSIGKSCRYSCIEKNDACRVDFDPDVTESLSSFEKMLEAQVAAGKKKDSAVSPTLKAPKAPKVPIEPEKNNAKKAAPVVTGNTQWARDDAAYFDKTFKVGTSTPGSKDKINWSDSIKNGTKIGQGGFGKVMLVESRKGEPYVVKRGKVGIEESNIIKTLGEADLGPKLILGQTAKEKSELDGNSYVIRGRIAMSRVPGKDYSEFDLPSDKVGNTTIGDAFWLLRSQVHRMGIAHNDTHSGNVLIDDKGKSRFVDMGLSQANAKAALSEALGVFASRKFLPSGTDAIKINKLSGDFNPRLDPQMGIHKGIITNDSPRNLLVIRDNLPRVYDKMRQFGLTDSDIAKIVVEQIRQPEERFQQGPWSKLTRSKALELINILYEGVGEG